MNSKGEFNVPIGSSPKPAICQPNILRACHRALQGVDVRKQDFAAVKAGRGDFVYFDPPYHPLAGGSFTDYARLGFGKEEQIALRDYCVDLHDRGVKVLLSNSDTSFIHDLYKNEFFRIEQVQAPRMVNRNAGGRGAINELLVSNYRRVANAV